MTFALMILMIHVISINLNLNTKGHKAVFILNALMLRLLLTQSNSRVCLCVESFACHSLFRQPAVKTGAADFCVLLSKHICHRHKYSPTVAPLLPMSHVWFTNVLKQKAPTNLVVVGISLTGYLWLWHLLWFYIHEFHTRASVPKFKSGFCEAVNLSLPQNVFSQCQDSHSTFLPVWRLRCVPRFVDIRL